MADGIVKSVRVRAVNTNIDERHSGLGDIEVRVIHDGGKNYKVGWIPKGGYGISYDFKKKGKYESYTPDNFIAAVMYQQSRHEKNLNASIVDVNDFNQDYYEIIQDPWVEGDVPLKRSFGKDPYYLNNQTKVSIFWFIGEKQSITKKAFENLDLRFDQEGAWIGGVEWSDEFGREETDKSHIRHRIVKDGEVSRYVKSNIVKYVLISNEESGEKFTVDTNITEFISSFSSTPNADSAHQWGSAIASSVTDEQILSKIIEVWKKKVTDYDALGVCYKKAHPDKYLPKHFSCNEIVYKSPISPPPEEPEPTPTEESVQTQGTPKIKLSVVLPEELELKVKEDLNEVKVYIGEPPLKPGEFVFQDDFDNLGELDPEFMESEFAGVEEGGEQLFTEEEYDEESAAAQTADLAVDEAPNNTPGASTGIKSTGTYTSVLTKESSKDPMKYGKIKYGYNGVPYYGQYDKRWANVIYGLSEPKDGVRAFIEAKIGKVKKALVSVSWKGKDYKIKCAHSSGTGGFSSIQGGGCGITSFSMVINYWMIKNTKEGVGVQNTYTSPVKMAKMACDTGARKKTPDPSGTGPNGAFFKKIKDIYGLKASFSSKSEVESLVKKGHPQVVCGRGWTGYRGDGSTKVQGGGHFIVITGYDTSTKTWRVNDPGSRKGTYYFKGSSLPKELTAFYKVSR
jgi:hypothetical protein